MQNRRKKSHYIGETHRTFFDRASEQAQNLKNHSEGSALYKHWKICHPQEEEPPAFEYKCLKSFKTSTERQLTVFLVTSFSIARLNTDTTA